LQLYHLHKINIVPHIKIGGVDAKLDLHCVLARYFTNLHSSNIEYAYIVASTAQRVASTHLACKISLDSTIRATPIITNTIPIITLLLRHQYKITTHSLATTRYDLIASSTLYTDCHGRWA
jgi:hypothetical protein